MSRRHYLDHNATAPVRPEVIEAVSAAMADVGNASSIHHEGRSANSKIEGARDSLRRLVNAPVNGVVFTSGGTEAIHAAINGLVRAGKVERIYVSAIEHPAVSENARGSGAPVISAPVTPDGVIDLEQLRTMLAAEQDGEFLVCLMAANNETGVIQPVQDVADIVHAAGGLLFVDAAQAAGKIPVNFVMSGADVMAVTAHKFGGPLGVGALIAGPNLPLAPVLRGGGQELNRRAGTLNAPAIVGFGLACDLAADSLARRDEIAGLRDEIEAALVADGAKIWGADAARLPGTLCYSASGFLAETQLMAFDLAGVAVSSGSACSSGKVKASHVLAAMGANDDEAQSAIRVSLGWNSTKDDVEAFIKAWRAAYARVKARAA